MRRDTCGPTGENHATPSHPDALARWRHHWWNPASAAPDGGEDLLSLLAAAEYSRDPRHRAAHLLCAGDLQVADLRRSARAGTPSDPLRLVAAAHGTPVQRSALAEAWAVTVGAGHRVQARSALRSRLLAPVGAAEAACLLDLADADGLRPLTAAECAPHARGEDPALRHAALRYLSGIPGGQAALPARPVDPGDPYEAMLLSAARERAEPGAPGGTEFRNAVKDLPARPGVGLVAAQSMMLGRLQEPGAGLSGGMSVLVTGLGDAMAATRHVSRVLTLVLMDATDLRRGQPLVARLGDGHWALRIPVAGNEPVDAAGAPALRPAIAWWATRLLRLPGAAPDVVHARFADDCSLAVADAARRCRSRFAFTVTPDPHRTMGERHRDLAPASCAEPASALRLDLHRVFAADRLVARCDLLITIPGRAGVDDLGVHFPQLGAPGSSRRIASPPEGIPPYTPADTDERTALALSRRLFRGGEHTDGLDATARDMRLFLSVGRLHPVKQQDRLVEAWIEAGLHRSTAMLLIGGSAGISTRVEDEMRARIAKLLSGEPQARRNLALWSVLPNHHVRILERALASGSWCGPAVYVCPSAKEEFGLAVLEAMDAGLPAAGPERGGVPHYIQDGTNGFLLPTHSTTALAEHLTALANRPPAELADIAAKGRKTVAARFSAATMARDLAAEYHRLTQRPL